MFGEIFRIYSAVVIALRVEIID
uniref:NADH-plastoquinone oxidoreductase subunit 1 n=1 Tax=Heterorhabditis bacteriophora TaxID=37862 RepID=A0A1I7WB49_HETBA